MAEPNVNPNQEPQQQIPAQEQAVPTPEQLRAEAAAAEPIPVAPPPAFTPEQLREMEAAAEPLPPEYIAPALPLVREVEVAAPTLPPEGVVSVVGAITGVTTPYVSPEERVRAGEVVSAAELAAAGIAPSRGVLGQIEYLTQKDVEALPGGKDNPQFRELIEQGYTSEQAVETIAREAAQDYVLVKDATGKTTRIPVASEVAASVREAFDPATGELRQPIRTEYISALAELAPHYAGGGQYDLVDAVRKGVQDDTLRTAGFTDVDIASVRDYIARYDIYQTRIAEYEKQMADYNAQLAIISKLEAANIGAADTGFYLNLALARRVVSPDELRAIGYTQAQIDDATKRSTLNPEPVNLGNWISRYFSEKDWSVPRRGVASEADLREHDSRLREATAAYALKYPAEAPELWQRVLGISAWNDPYWRSVVTELPSKLVSLTSPLAPVTLPATIALAGLGSPLAYLYPAGQVATPLAKAAAPEGITGVRGAEWATGVIGAASIVLPAVVPQALKQMGYVLHNVPKIGQHFPARPMTDAQIFRLMHQSERAAYPFEQQILRQFGYTGPTMKQIAEGMSTAVSQAEKMAWLKTMEELMGTAAGGLVPIQRLRMIGIPVVTAAMYETGRIATPLVLPSLLVSPKGEVAVIPDIRLIPPETLARLENEGYIAISRYDLPEPVVTIPTQAAELLVDPLPSVVPASAQPRVEAAAIPQVALSPLERIFVEQGYSPEQARIMAFFQERADRDEQLRSLGYSESDIRGMTDMDKDRLLASAAVVGVEVSVPPARLPEMPPPMPPRDPVVEAEERVERAVRSLEAARSAVAAQSAISAPTSHVMVRLRRQQEEAELELRNATSNLSYVKSRREAEVRVPFVVTQSMVAQLLKLGYSRQDIDKMTPLEVWDILSASLTPEEAARVGVPRVFPGVPPPALVRRLEEERIPIGRPISEILPEPAPPVAVPPRPLAEIEPRIAPQPVPVTPPLALIAPRPVPLVVELPEPAIAPRVVPAPTPVPVPAPLPIPAPVPVPVPPPVTQPPPPPPLPRPPALGEIDLRVRRPSARMAGGFFPNGTIVWKQGAFWKYLPPPWDAPKPYTLARGIIPQGVSRPYGRTPRETLEIIDTGVGTLPKVPRRVLVDLGWTDIEIIDGRKIRFVGDGEYTDVGERIPLNTQGMSVKENEASRRGRKLSMDEDERRLDDNVDEEEQEEATRLGTVKPEISPPVTLVRPVYPLAPAPPAPAVSGLEDEEERPVRDDVIPETMLSEADRAEILGQDGEDDLSDVLTVTEEDIMGRPERVRRSNRARRRVSREPEELELGGMRY